MRHPRFTIPAWRRYAVALACVVIVTLLRASLLKVLSSQFMFAVFYPAVMTAAWYGGMGPGMLVTLLSCILAPAIGAPPRTFHWLTQREWIGVAIFTFNGTTISFIIESLHRARHRLMEHKAELEALVERRTAELEETNEQLKAEMAEREKSTAQMLEAASQLRDVKAAVSDRAIVAEIDTMGVILSVNDNLSAFLKYPSEELVGHDYRTFYWEQDTGDVADPMWEALKAGKVWKRDIRVRAKDGASLWVDATLFSDQDDETKQNRYIVIWVDITDRKRAEQALRQSEARYRAIGETLEYGVWMADAEGHNIFASDALLNLVGVTQEQFSKYGWGDMLHPDEAESMVADWKECVRTGGNWDRELTFRGVDGEWYVVLGRGGPVRDDDGNLCGWAGINVDITKLKRTEKALRESEARYRAIGESLNYGVWICEADGRNTYASESFLNLIGITQEQCSNFGWGDLLHPDDAEGTIAAWKECAESSNLWDREHRFKGADGQWHHILARGVPLKDERGKVTGWAGINLDISKLKATEFALQDSEAHLRRVLDSLFFFVGVMKPDGTVTEMNRATLEASGIGSEEVVGKKFWDCMWWSRSSETQEKMLDAVARAAAGEAVRFDVEGLVANEQFLWVDFSIAPMRDAQGTITHLIPSAVDITERKQAEKQILQLNTELEGRVAVRTEELRAANAELRQQFETIRRFEEEILAVTKREQVRIGQDLHDDLGQQLAGLWCFMRVVEKNLMRQQSPEAENAARISEMLEKSLATTRSLAHGLLPVPQEPRGLMSALTTLAARLTEMFHINCKLDCPIPVLVDDNTKATHLYRIAQESVTNAVKHGKARNVMIELTSGEYNVALVIHNDGQPLPENKVLTGGMGMRIMGYRAGVIGGVLRIEDDEKGGVTLTCTMPITAPHFSDTLNDAHDAPQP